MTAALKLRDAAWAAAPDCIPSWVRGRDIGLDQFYTKPEIAAKCWQSLCKIMKARGHNIADFKFIEPSAGTGAFYDLLPRGSRIGVDVEVANPAYVRQDFLTWNPKKNGKRFAVIGNPPFGYRGWLALNFLNHASEFCDFVGFILPMSFQSEGKGSPKHRVPLMSPIHFERLPDDIFVRPDGSILSANTIWQVWERSIFPWHKKPDLSACDEYFDLITVDLRKERLCGVKRMHECDFFLQRTFYSEPPDLVKSFAEVKYTCGYGFILKRDKRRIKQLLKTVDWVKHSNLATHHCRHISMYHIRQALLDIGLCNG